MWYGKAEYADGKIIERHYNSWDDVPDAEQQHAIEENLLQAHPDCIWYSVIWIEA